MPVPEMTEELKNNLQVLKMRSVMDPKHFYKKNDMEVLPKYFQVQILQCYFYYITFGLSPFTPRAEYTQALHLVGKKDLGLRPITKQVKLNQSAR